MAVAGPLIWHLFGDLLTDIDRDLSSNDLSGKESDSDRDLGYFEEYLEQFAGRVKFLYHFAFPYFLFFLLWTVFTIWAEEWLK